jgi:hypothetical protein
MRFPQKKQTSQFFDNGFVKITINPPSPDTMRITLSRDSGEFAFSLSRGEVDELISKLQIAKKGG